MSLVLIRGLFLFKNIIIFLNNVNSEELYFVWEMYEFIDRYIREFFLKVWRVFWELWEGWEMDIS